MSPELREKILELFAYRELPYLMKLGNDGIIDEELLALLIELQADIYHLDHELETQWQVDMDVIAARWVSIHARLSDLGVSTEQHDEYCRHIYKYQRHELELREHKYPSRLSMEYFYFYKSCDVKLLRKIIYDRYPSLSKVVKLSEWRVFDLITEINDDVEDLYEDMTTINGNRFLLSLLIEGRTATEHIYQTYIDSLRPRVEALSSPLCVQMSAPTLKDTSALLQQRLSEYSSTELASARIAQYVTSVGV